MEITQPNYRSILKEEFELRARRNSQYSLRAFARDIGIQPSKLSEALNRKRGISASAARRIAKRLGFTPAESYKFVTLVESEHGRSKLTRKSAQLRLARMLTQKIAEKISLDYGEIVSNWYHYALLDLTQFTSFESDPNWIAKALGISRIEAEQSLARLMNSGLLKKSKSGKLVAAHSFLSTPNDIPSQALKTYHSQMIQKANDAIALCPVNEREFASLTMAIDANKIVEAKEALRNFRRKFCAELESSSAQKNSVYALTLQFFPLAKEEKKPIKKENRYENSHTS